MYDCVYVALAEREGAILLTADARLVERAARGRLKVRVVDLATL